MSDRKVFAQDNTGYCLMADEKDVAVPFFNRQKVYEWCGANRISIELLGTLAGTDVWRVRDDRQRAWFAMRWA